MRDDKTSRGWPLPYKNNTLADDVERIRNAFNAIDSEFSTIEENIETNLSANFEARISALEAKLQDPDIFEKYGFYIDDDGDLCQHLEDTPDSGGQSGGSTAPTVIVDGETVSLTTQADVQELLNELNIGNNGA